jgi:hypothetical protein
MTGATLAVCVLSAAIAVGCGDEPPPPDPAPDHAPATSLPSGCRPAQVARLLDELFAALNRGDEAAAAAIVIDRQMLARLERPVGERPLRLRAVIVGYARGLGHIAFQGAGRLMGKGAVDCGTRRLVAIGLGAVHERMAPLCGGRRACAHHWG